ncbi:MAG TPA: MFS transporter [Solirubrobacterales bacterium]|jgi:MFS family permease|nr:MFS transporter [Solirubrobacterales bacterium]
MATDTAVAPIGGLAAYRRVLGAPHVRPLVAFALLARMPIGMGAVAIILFIHAQTGSFGAAGLVAGAYTVGLGITGPTLARLIDRRGSRLVIVPGALIVMAAMVAVVLLGEAGAGTLPLVLAGFLAGAGSTPIGGITRQRWPDLVGAAELPTAYALDAVMIEVVFISGPLLAGVLAATVGTAAGLIVAGVLGIVGSVGFARLSTVKPGGDPGAERHWLGALRSPTLRLLVLSDLPLAGTFGALDVTLPAFGAHHGAAALGGPFGAALALGSGIGGLAYGARPGIFGPPRRSLILLGAVMFLTCLPLLVATEIPEMFVFAAVAGITLAPQITVRNQVIQNTLVQGTATEAFTWVALATTVGASIGSAVVGPLVEAAGWRAGAVVAVVLPGVATLVVLARRDLLE